eukprot:6050339-Amphidinium_carterae.1
MPMDLHIPLKVQLHADATAASGIAHTRGAGKVRHIECGTLWRQRLITVGRVTLTYKRGQHNPADLGTKHLDAKTMAKHLAFLGWRLLEGRSKNNTQCSALIPFTPWRAVLNVMAPRPLFAQMKRRD